MTEYQLLFAIQEAIREANDRKRLKELITNMGPDPFWKARNFLFALKRQGIDLERMVVK